MSTDWRALCAELADALDHNRQCLMDDRSLTHPLADKARAALAQPEPEVVGPTLQLPEQAPNEHPPSNLDRREVAAWYHGHGCGWQAARTALAAEADGPAVRRREPASVTGEPSDQDLYDYWISTSPELGCADPVGFARAALAEPEPEGHPAPAAAAGLCELADDLREQASQGYCEFISREDLRRVADVLEQLAVVAHKQEPAVGPPSDDELLELAQHHSVSYTMSDGSVVYPLQHGCDMRDDVLSFARAVLARFGSQPAPPAGELLKEAAWLRNECSAENADGNWISMSIDQALDLASLLERQAAPVPVAVSERLPRPEDCDAEGRCWWWDGEWGLVEQRFTDYHVTHWLPAHALPLPSGEVA